MDLKEKLCKLKELINKDDISLSELLELYHLRSFFLKNYGITYDMLISQDIDQLYNRIKSMNVTEKTKIDLDKLIEDCEQEHNEIYDIVKQIRKGIIRKGVNISRGGKKFKFEITDTSVNIKIPSNCEVNFEKDPVEKETSKIIKSKEFGIPILKKGKHRYRVIKQPYTTKSKEEIRDIYNTLIEMFDKEKAETYFQRIFSLDSKIMINKILED